MAGRLFNAKLLSLEKMAYCELDLCEQISVKIWSQLNFLIDENALEIMSAK